jgi:hypothetical protein
MMSLSRLMKVALGIVIGVAVGWLLPSPFDNDKVWCLPYEISLQKQNERRLQLTEVGKVFAPEPGVLHDFWCYRKT